MIAILNLQGNSSLGYVGLVIREEVEKFAMKYLENLNLPAALQNILCGMVSTGQVSLH